MDVSLLIRHRLQELGLDQKDLAVAAEVTESYISQLLARKKAPPAPGRTDIYDKLGSVLKLPKGELSELAEVQRKDELRKRVAEPPQPLLKECRQLILRKCHRSREKELRIIFDKEPFGELERLITQKLLDVAQGFAWEKQGSDEWLRWIARSTGRSFRRMRVAALDFLDVDVFHVSAAVCASFLDPMIDSWEIDLKTFGMRVALNPKLASGSVKRFEFVEQRPEVESPLEPGLEQFLQDTSLSGDANKEEIEFLKALKFSGRRPTAIYYYRELQNLRDPLHFSRV